MSSKAKFLRKRMFHLYLWVIFTAALPYSVFGGSSDLHQTVKQAYQLRMDGKADQAVVLLNQILSSDSTNAAAHYELARTEHHMALGNPREMMGKINAVQSSIKKAVKYAPDNMVYSYFNAQTYYLQAYISLQFGQPGVNDKVNKTAAAFEQVLELKPDCREALLSLVEIYGWFPADKGGDRVKAEQYAEKLEKVDEVFAAKANVLLLPEDAERTAYWRRINKENPETPDILEELAKAYFYENNADEAEKYIKEAVKIDPQKIILYLDLGRFYIMSAMRDKSVMNDVLPLAEAALNKYLESNPINPLKAFTYGLLAKVKWGSGDKDAGSEFRKKAAELDPFYSKASAVPGLMLFTALDEMQIHHSYFSKPF